MNNFQISNKIWGLRTERLRVTGVFGLEIFIQPNESTFIFFEFNGHIRSLGLKEIF